MTQLTTTQRLTQEGKDMLEALVDGSTLTEVLSALANICEEKCDHLRSNWQDANAAMAWQHASTKVWKAAESAQVARVS